MRRTVDGMGTNEENMGARPLKISAHVCPQCGHAVDLKDLGLRSGATGLVTCPKCEWSGPVNIGIVPKEPAEWDK